LPAEESPSPKSKSAEPATVPVEMTKIPAASDEIAEIGSRAASGVEEQQPSGAPLADAPPVLPTGASTFLAEESKEYKSTQAPPTSAAKDADVISPVAGHEEVRQHGEEGSATDKRTSLLSPGRPVETIVAPSVDAPEASRDADQPGAEKAASEEEDSEMARRQALARRMAAMGGVKMGEVLHGSVP
jgi:hypothetical protein